jgi:GTP-binding protein HflX
LRQFNLNGYQNILLSDTIGFIRKLPHNMIAILSQHFTGNDRRRPDLSKVADISSPHCLQQLQTVNEVLNELGVGNRPSLIVFNKVDKMNKEIYKIAQKSYPEAVFMSALRKLRIADLKQALVQAVSREGRQLQINSATQCRTRLRPDPRSYDRAP